MGPLQSVGSSQPPWGHRNPCERRGPRDRRIPCDCRDVSRPSGSSRPTASSQPGGSQRPMHPSQPMGASPCVGSSQPTGSSQPVAACDIVATHWAVAPHTRRNSWEHRNSERAQSGGGQRIALGWCRSGQCHANHWMRTSSSASLHGSGGPQGGADDRSHESELASGVYARRIHCTKRIHRPKLGKEKDANMLHQFKRNTQY